MTYARELSEIAAAITVDGSKNIGIGTGSPSSFGKLGVVSAVGQNAAGFTDNTNYTFEIKSGGPTVAHIGGATGSALALGSNGTEKVRIDSSGNVGIGTVSPATKLQVVGEIRSSSDISNTSDPVIYSYNGSTAGTIQAGIQFVGSGQNLRFFTANTERMRINSDGRLLLGRTAPYYGTKLSINYNPNTEFGLILYMDSTTYSNAAIAFVNTSYGIVGSISANGTSTSYNTSSDYRLKENIAPMTGALAKVQALKPVTYDWKSGGSSQGFIAHELQVVVPECVTGEKDGMRTEQYEISPAIPAEVDEDGKVIKEAVEAVMGEREVPAYQGIDTSFLVATLTAAIQEQQTMIEELKAKVAALEAA